MIKAPVSVDQNTGTGAFFCLLSLSGILGIEFFCDFCSDHRMFQHPVAGIIIFFLILSDKFFQFIGKPYFAFKLSKNRFGRSAFLKQDFG